MQEFSSISVSSYEAGTLADRLGEQSRDGWSVVAIVPTGSTVTAYLSREADAATTMDDIDSTADVTATIAAADQSDTVETAEDTDGEETAGASVGAADPVDEAAGWAAGAATAATAPPADAADATAEPAATEPAATETAVEPAEAAPEATTTAAAAGAAPAGWYADPSSRFELRYWDGTQWTEHVSRAGQQYTDPPVA